MKTKAYKTFKHKESHHFYLLKNAIKVLCTFADLLFFFSFGAPVFTFTFTSSALPVFFLFLGAFLPSDDTLSQLGTMLLIVEQQAEAEVEEATAEDEESKMASLVCKLGQLFSDALFNLGQLRWQSSLSFP